MGAVQWLSKLRWFKEWMGFMTATNDDVHDDDGDDDDADGMIN